MSQKRNISKTKGKIFIKSETNRFNELPDDILSCIVSYFTVRDAANASVLSSRWRPLCASMSDLEFNLDSMYPTHEDFIRNMDICLQYKDIFVRGVNQFLRYYQGTRLVSFKVDFCLENDSMCDVDQWVRFAFRMGVEALLLSLCCIACYNFDLRSKGRDLYTLRSELLAQGSVAKLHTLSLCSCILGPGVINQLSSLKLLSLANVTLDPAEVESIVSCCSTLESFSLASCTLPPKLCISGSLYLLKYLSVADCSGVEMIDLSATNLTTFDYDGTLISISFPRVSSLKRIYIRAPDGKVMQYVFCQLGKDVPLVERLLLYAATNWIQCLPECITTFSKIKELEFFSTSITKFDVSKIIVILEACPLMEKLYLVISSQLPKQGMRQLTTPPPGSVHKYLKEVHIGGFHFNAIYIEVVMYMLEYAAALERMVIDPKMIFYFSGNAWVTYINRTTWDEGEREKVSSYMQDHSKSSIINVIV